MAADDDAAAGTGQPDPAVPAAGAGMPAGPNSAVPDSTRPGTSGPAPGTPDPPPGVPVPASGPPEAAGPPAAPAPGRPLLSLVHAAKSFGAVRAVVDGSIDLYGGEAHALVGENGAGKSTVVKILAGVYQPDEGQLLIEGQPVVLPGPAAAQAAGIAVIYQEPTLFPDLTVAENIFMGRQPLLAARRIDRAFATDWAQRLRLKYGRLTDPVSMLSGGNQQKVVLAKWLGRGPALLIVDEPTRGTLATPTSPPLTA